jgi:hypothetical protein
MPSEARQGVSMSNLLEMPNRIECKHEWKEEYYGWACVHCKLFYAFGCAPWEYAEDDDFDTFDGEQEDCEEEVWS